MELDSKWLKPRKERPRRRGLIGALKKETNLKCLILTCLIYGCAVAIVWCRITRVTKVDIDFNAFPITSTRQISPCDDGYIYIPSAFVVMLYLLYLIECWHCKAWVQLRFEKTDVHSAYRQISEMKEAQPLVWWKAVCYHYVRRTREIARIHNGDTYPATQVYYERVNSNLAAGCFYFGYCGVKDISPELVDLEKYTATKIRLSKGFLFASSAAAQEFEEQRVSFFQDQERYDDYMEMKEGLDLASNNLGDFKETMISWTCPDNLPWFARSTVFWCCNFLLLSWPLRLILELNTAHVHFQVTKLFGINYVPPLSPLNGLISSENHSTRNTQHQRNQRRPRHPNLIQSLNPDNDQTQSRRSARHASSGGLSAIVAPTPEQSFLHDHPHQHEHRDDEMQPLLLSSSSGEKPEKDTKPDIFCSTEERQNNYLIPSPNSNNSQGFQSYFNFRHSNRNPFLYFTRNMFGIRRNNDPRMARSVTLLMTKGELTQFGFNYFDPDHFIKEDEDSERGNACDGSINNVTSRGYNASGGACAGAEGRILRDENSTNSFINNYSTEGLAPSYSQALLMEPNNGCRRTRPNNNVRPIGLIGTTISTHISSNANDVGGNGDSRTMTPNARRDLIQRRTNEEESRDSHSSGGCNWENRLLLQESENLMRNSNSNLEISDRSISLGRESGIDSRGYHLGEFLRERNNGDGNVPNFSQRTERELIGMDFGSSIGRPVLPLTTRYSESGTHPSSSNSISSSSLVLNTLAPRGMSRVPIDLTQPVVLTVPTDPRNPSAGPTNDNPPTYEEALRTSRPVFLPTLARIRRCFTERDIHSRLSSSNFWLNYQNEDDEDNDSSTKQSTSHV